jgi:hypothetical protein
VGHATDRTADCKHCSAEARRQRPHPTPPHPTKPLCARAGGGPGGLAPRGERVLVRGPLGEAGGLHHDISRGIGRITEAGGAQGTGTLSALRAVPLLQLPAWTCSLLGTAGMDARGPGRGGRELAHVAAVRRRRQSRLEQRPLPPASRRPAAGLSIRRHLQGQVLSIVTASNLLFTGGQDSAIRVWSFDAASNQFTAQVCATSRAVAGSTAGSRLPAWAAPCSHAWQERAPETSGMGAWQGMRQERGGRSELRCRHAHSPLRLAAPCRRR